MHRLSSCASPSGATLRFTGMSCIHIAPIVHDLRPRLYLLRIDFRHFAQDTCDICLCVFLIVSIIRDQLLDIRIGVRLRGLCPDRNAQSRSPWHRLPAR